MITASHALFLGKKIELNAKNVFSLKQAPNYTK